MGAGPDDAGTARCRDESAANGAALAMDLGVSGLRVQGCLGLRVPGLGWCLGCSGLRGFRVEGFWEGLFRGSMSCYWECLGCFGFCWYKVLIGGV